MGTVGKAGKAVKAKRREQSIESVNNASVMSKGSRLTDLCEEDKLKIGVVGFANFRCVDPNRG